MICLGIDPAQDGFHAVALFRDGDGVVFMETVREVMAEKSKRFVMRPEMLHNLHHWTREMIVGLQQEWGDGVVYVFCEEPVVAGARNLRTSLKLAQSVGAIVTGATEQTPKVYLVPVSKWKTICGSGSAGKPQVTGWLSSTHPAYAALCDGSQDLIDACCIALYGMSVVDNAELVRTVGGAGQL